MYGSFQITFKFTYDTVECLRSIYRQAHTRESNSRRASEVIGTRKQLMKCHSEKKWSRCRNWGVLDIHTNLFSVQKLLFQYLDSKVEDKS